MSSFTGAPIYIRGVLAMAFDNVFATQPTTNHPYEPNVTTLIVAAVISSIGVCVFIFVVYLCIRRRRNRAQVLDIEEGPDEEPIPLQDLPPIEPPGNLYESGNPEFSTLSLPRRRTMNERTMALSSNPPSQTDLTTAERSFHSVAGTPEIIQDIPTEPSSPPLPKTPQREREECANHMPGHRPSMSRLGRNRRHGMIFDDDSFSGDGDTPVRPVVGPLRPAGPGIETMPEVLETFHRQESLREKRQRIRQERVGPDFPASWTPSTVKEESTPDITDGGSAESNSGSDKERGDQQLSLSHQEDDDHEKKKPDQSEDHNDAVEQTAPAYNSRFEGGVRGARGNWHFSYSDEELDEDDPRYDVVGAVQKFGKVSGRRVRRVMPKPQPATEQQPSSSNNNTQYACLEREFTCESLVPAPLNLVRRNQTVREPASPSAGVPVPRPVSVAGAESPGISGEKVRTSRPRSFIIRDWPPQNGDPIKDHWAWQMAPTEEVIERSRNAREKLEREEEARKRVVAEAGKDGERLSEEEVARRVRLEYERGNHYTLEAKTYKPPTPPPRPQEVSPAPRRAANGRVYGQRQQAPAPRLGGLYPAANRDDRSVRPAPAFASSQALPLAATMSSIVAQDGSHSGSPVARPSLPPSPSPLSPPRHGRLPRSHQDPDLSRYL
ncbi:hypothetical protein HD806DRAFT_542467 [Xylariaceae sp. AK1471]|nr:hypothetical protein HD806DRAFT_542467 [Xylariaceae sp. AK1471]